MLAMTLTRPRGMLEPTHRPAPSPGPGQVRVQVRACAVCRTDLHVIDGELPGTRHPIVPGHEIVGIVDACGAGVDGLRSATRVGIPWLGLDLRTCGYCRAGRENLCDAARFTGYQIDGGYAEYAVADERYCLPLPAGLRRRAGRAAALRGLHRLSRARAWRATRERLGLYGFGAAAHIVAQVARFQGRDGFAFTRPGDDRPRRTSRASSARRGPAAPTRRRPVPLDAAIIFAPAGELVPAGARRRAQGRHASSAAAST